MTNTSDPQNSRGRRTRAALLNAIAEIVEADGFDALTMGEVAKRAGVSRRAVYLHFANRPDLIPALHDHVVEELGLVDSLEHVWNAANGPEALREWAYHLARVHTNVLEVDRAVRYSQQSDPVVRQYRLDTAERQLDNCRFIIGMLADEGNLSPEWTVEDAVDMLWSLVSTDMMDALINERNWDSDKFGVKLAFMLERTFLNG
ncbi:TetR/AcrR family transcriptional regulator [Haloglycomyces albus]|uniref:TetR/AcrR family transcriptional regulator n=1 Tax=Haloglycomyces albus TaxID=526067 RepID=UPI00046D2691|nr:TetR/AcrR family transcriptional regulator [Haloglycomyces albus]